MTGYMTRAEAAQYLRFGLNKLHNLTESGKIPYYKDGGRILYSPDDLDGYMARCRRAPSETVNPYDTFRRRRRT